jgi:hypothetical protein
VSLCDDALFAASYVTSHRQLSDIYLLGVAHTNDGVLATFNQGIPFKAIVGGRRELVEVIAPGG